MSPKRIYVDYLHDMVESAEKAGQFVRGMNLSTFEADDKTVYAVIRALEVIGEAAKKVPSPVQKQMNLPWRAIVGMRDKLIHEYFGVNRAVLWRTVQEDLPPLKAAIQKLLKELG